MKTLPTKPGVQQHVAVAVKELKLAVALLGEFGDERDAGDLEEATEEFLGNVGAEV